jgi:hypothetical protein
MLAALVEIFALFVLMLLDSTVMLLDCTAVELDSVDTPLRATVSTARFGPTLLLITALQ